jgi:hypothetical protein
VERVDPNASGRLEDKPFDLGLSHHSEKLGNLQQICTSGSPARHERR